MDDRWSDFVREYRLRHGLSQESLAAVMGVSQRTISRWERGDDRPSLPQQKRLRDLGWSPSGSIFSSLLLSVRNCPVPRALSRTERITLAAVSPAALAKRPTIRDWIGVDLAPIACGVLQEILDDRDLQRGIAAGEVATLITTTRSVLRTAEHAHIGLYRTTISYFFHEGVLYQDAIGVPARPTAVEGYQAVGREELLSAIA